MGVGQWLIVFKANWGGGHYAFTVRTPRKIGQRIVHVRHFNAAFFKFFWLRCLQMIWLMFYAGVGRGWKNSGNSCEFYANSEVFPLFY